MIQRFDSSADGEVRIDDDGEFVDYEQVKAFLAPITDEEWSQHIDSGLTCVGHANAILAARREKLG